MQEILARFLIFFLIPIVVFLAVVSTPMNASRILLPLIVAAFCTLISQIFRRTSKNHVSASRLGIWSYACGSGNSGYFGIPLTYILLGPDYVATTLMAAFGFIIFESTFGFYYVARAHHTIRKSFYKLISLPALWAFVIGIMAQKHGLTLNATWQIVYKVARSSYSVLGMLMLILALSRLKSFKLNGKLIARVFTFKFLIWPVLMGLLLFVDKSRLHFFDEETRKVLFLLSLVPLPVNSVAYATALKTEPEETALVILVSTIFAVFYVPLIWLLGLF